MLSSGVSCKIIGAKQAIEYEAEVKRNSIPFHQSPPHFVPSSHPSLVLLHPFAYREICSPDYN